MGSFPVKRLGAVVIVVGLSGCGGGGDSRQPTAPTVPPAGPAPIAVTALDGVTGMPVAGTGPIRGLPGDSVEFAAPGYLTRGTLLPRDGRVFLWPLTVSEAYVRAIVYETWSFAGTQRLFRWPKAALTITPGVWAPAVAEIASTGVVTLSDSAEPDIEVRIDPSDPALGNFSAFTRCTVVGFAIDRCEVVTRDARLANSSLLTHELGHCLGLGHSPRAGDLMRPPGVGIDGFSSHERVLLTMMYAHRRPGNAPPDDDRALGLSTAVRRIFVVD
jgi:hypothetical protein